MTKLGYATALTAVVFACDAAVNIANTDDKHGWDVLSFLFLVFWGVAFWAARPERGVR